MFIKERFKVIRKHDCDFWNLIYYRLDENRFWNYYRYSLIYKIKLLTRQKEFRIRPKRNIRLNVLRKGYNPFLTYLDKNLLNIKNNINFFKLFLSRGLRYISYIHKRCFYYRQNIVNDLLLGTRSSYRIYKPIIRKYFLEKKMFFQRIIFFYNSFDMVKLKRFGRLGRKGQFGGVNYFFLLLESRIDSILLRLNMGNKFLIRQVIREKKVLIENNIITYPNYIVKKFQQISFIKSFKELIYISLFRKIPLKMFFVQPPIYFEINYNTLIILILPKLIDPSFVPYPFIKSKSSLIKGLHTILWGW
jgi:hypothetical protein